MRASVVLFAVGELLALAGIAMWSIPLALVLLGVQCVALALFREQAAVRKPVKRPAKSAVKRHRASSVRSLVKRGRPKLRLVGRSAA